MYDFGHWDVGMYLDINDISLVFQLERKYPCEASVPAMSLMKNLAQRLIVQVKDSKTRTSAVLALYAIEDMMASLPLHGPNRVLPALMTPIERIPELWDLVEARCSALPERLRKHARVMDAVERRQRMCFMFASTYLIIALTQLPELTIPDFEDEPRPGTDEDEGEDDHNSDGGSPTWDGVRTNERELKRLTQVFEWGLQSMYSDLFLEDDHRWEHYREELELACAAEDEKRQQAEMEPNRKRKAPESYCDDDDDDDDDYDDDDDDDCGCGCRASLRRKVLRRMGGSDDDGLERLAGNNSYLSDSFLRLPSSRMEVSITSLPIELHALKAMSEAIREDSRNLADSLCDSLLSTMPRDSLALDTHGSVKKESLHLRGDTVKGDWREGIGDWGPGKYLPLEVLTRSTKQIASVAKRIGKMGRRERERRMLNRQANAAA